MPQQTTKFTTMIVDDESLARAGIREMLADEPDFDLIGECEDGFQAIEKICQLAPKLVFLDIQMPEIGGFEVLKRLSADSLPAIVFVTAYHEYALQAFEVHATDYLLKPLDPQRFRAALAQARRQLLAAETNQKLQTLQQQLALRSANDQRWLVKDAKRMWTFNAEDIDWVEASGDYVYLHAKGKKHLVRITMRSIEKKLDPHRFQRIHRSTIVNLDRIAQLQPQPHGNMIVKLKDGFQLRLSRRFRSRLTRLFENPR